MVGAGILRGVDYGVVEGAFGGGGGVIKGALALAEALTRSLATAPSTREESFGLVSGGDPLAFAMIIRLLPNLVDESRRVEAEEGLLGSNSIPMRIIHLEIETETPSAFVVALHLLHPRETDITSSPSSRLHFVVIVAGRPLPRSSSSSLVLLFPGRRVSSPFISPVVVLSHRPRPASRLLPVHRHPLASLVVIGRWSPPLPGRWFARHCSSSPRLPLLLLLAPGRRHCSSLGRQKKGIYDQWLSSSSLQTQISQLSSPKIPAAAQSPKIRRRTIAEDSPPLPSPSLSTAIIDVDRDSSAQSFIRNPRRLRLAARPCPIESVGRRHCRCAVFFFGAAATARSSPPVPLFAPLIRHRCPLLSICRCWPSTGLRGPVICPLCDHLCRRRWSPLLLDPAPPPPPACRWLPHAILRAAAWAGSTAMRSLGPLFRGRRCRLAPP
ncbi:hypothetical protein Syun_016550 [Stephania yunnanensis]|uniref:Uncharacterized protein n=1 Tax=Stephania yunnanensis TaxID=152371 RepID=A0AAP0J5F7_9MAGN